jgi:hypothetical protein
MAIYRRLIRKSILTTAVFGLGVAGLAVGPAANAATVTSARPAPVAAPAAPRATAWQYGGKYYTYVSCAAAGISAVHGPAESPFDDWMCDPVIEGNPPKLQYYILYLHVKGT